MASDIIAAEIVAESASVPTLQTGNPQAPASIRISRQFIPELDGVRGIAVILVMLCHSYLLTGAINPVLFLGWSGVDLFFVLSGFLITGILLDSRDAQNYFSSFYIRRVLRILPLYLVTVFAYFHLLLPLAHRFGQLTDLDGATEKWFWFQLSNWPRAFGADTGWLQHFWSLAIEEQFYLVWPLVVFITGRKWLPHVCAALIVAPLGLRFFYAHHHFAEFFLYELTPFRVEPLAFGALAALLVRNPPVLARLTEGRFLKYAATGGLWTMAAAVWFGKSTGPFKAPMATYGYTAFAVLYTALVLYAYLQSGSSTRVAAVLRQPALRSFGKYSYAIYVFHHIIFKAFSDYSRNTAAALSPHLRSIFLPLAVAAGIAASYGAGYLSWQLLEKHFWALKSRFALRF